MSTPTPIFDPEDPKLTAYALGELTDPAERAEVEQLLQHSPEAKLAMQEIQDITHTLTAEYDEERHAAVASTETSDLPPNVIPLTRWSPESRWRWLPAWATAAAVLLLVGSSAFLIFRASRMGRADMAAAMPSAMIEGDEPASEPVQELVLPEESAPPATTGTGSLASVPVPPAEMTTPANAEPEVTLDSLEKVPAPRLALADPILPADKEFVPPAPILPNAKRDPNLQNSVVGGVSAKAGANEVTRGTSSIAVAALPATAMSQAPRILRNDTRFYRAKTEFGAYDASKQLAKSFVTADNYADEAHSYDAKPGSPISAERAKLAQNEEFRDKALRELKPSQEFNTAAYDHLVENPFLSAKENQLSTFSIDVDTASYANVRRFLDAGSLPPPDAVRIEELINYFPYDYAPPTADSDKPFAVHLEAASCPWAPEHRLVRIGLKGKEIAQDKRPASNLVFLIDVSGSMEPPERLPLIRRAMRLLVEQLTDNDRVAIVTYAGNSGLVLPSTRGDKKDAILAALDRLEAGGSTNGASGITLAYKVAREGFIKGGTNRVILATDGDFNVGVTSQGDLIRLVQNEAKSGVFLSALGVGTDNYKDSTMQKLADKGNGNYNYIDRLEEARKVLVEQMSGTLVTIAKDVKIQVEFNPLEVSSYRLIGYEKRTLRKEDFNDDRIDAGEIGAGHSITALYEVVPFGQPTPGAAPAVDALKYDGIFHGARASVEEVITDKTAPAARASTPPEMLTVKIRHKAPDADKSERTYEVPLADYDIPSFAKASPEFKFAAAVAAFGLSLRDSPYKGGATLGAAVELAQEGKGVDTKGYRQEFIELARRAQALKDLR